MARDRHRARIAAFSAALLLTLLIGDVALGQSPPARSAGTEMSPSVAAAPAPAPLIVANRTVFLFRAKVVGVLPEARAGAARHRIESVLEKGGPGVVDTQEVPEGVLVTVDGDAVFRILDADLEPESDEKLEDLRARTVASLRQVLAEQKELRDFPRFFRSVVWALLYTLAFGFFLWILTLVARWSGARIEGLALRGVDRVKLGGFTVQYANKIVSYVRKAIAPIRWGAWLFAGYVWLSFILRLFPYSRPWGEELNAHLVGLASGMISSVADAVPGMVIVAVVVVITYNLTKSADAFFRAVERGTVSVPWAHPDTAEATRRIITVVLWMFAIVVSYPYLPGSSSEAFKGISVLLGVMISLGSTTVVGQILSGFIIIYARTFHPGDYVRIGETEGIVVTIGLFATKIDNMKRERLTIPNSLIVGTEVKNYTRPADELGVLLDTTVTIGYGVPWRQVHAMLLQAADLTPGLLKTPPPFVNQIALSDFYVEYRLLAYLERPETRLRTRGQLHARIQDAFNENGVQIMSPHYEADPAAPVFVPKEKWYAPPARPE